MHKERKEPRWQYKFSPIDARKPYAAFPSSFNNASETALFRSPRQPSGVDDPEQGRTTRSPDSYGSPGALRPPEIVEPDAAPASAMSDGHSTLRDLRDGLSAEMDERFDSSRLSMLGHRAH
jgi:hypothetical protein